MAPAATFWLGGCLAFGSGSGYPPSTIAPPGVSDGAVANLALSPAVAASRVDSVLRAEGYETYREHDRLVRTHRKTIAGDTTLVLRAEITSYELARDGEARSIVTVVGTFSVPSRAIRDALVHAGPQGAPSLWARVQAIAGALHPGRHVAP